MIKSNKERQAPTSVEEAEPSHLARYKFAFSFLGQNDTILDIPCGSGYGSRLLASKNSKVFGIDISDGAIKHAQEFFDGEGISFLTGDMENLRKKLPHNYYDIIVSFEGIEHIKHPELFLEDISRALKPSGKFIVSTPRKPHGSPYHIVEYSLEEFKSLLSFRFVVTQMFGQIYTDIFDLSKRKENPYDYKRFNFIAICEIRK